MKQLAIALILLLAIVAGALLWERAEREEQNIEAERRLVAEIDSLNEVNGRLNAALLARADSSHAVADAASQQRNNASQDANRALLSADLDSITSVLLAAPLEAVPEP